MEALKVRFLFYFYSSSYLFLLTQLKPMIKPDRNEEEIKATFREMMDDVLNSSNPNFGDYNIL